LPEADGPQAAIGLSLRSLSLKNGRSRFFREQLVRASADIIGSGPACRATQPHRQTQARSLGDNSTEGFMTKLLISAAVIALAGSALAQGAMTVMTTATPDALAWKDAPALPKGAQVAILMGDPTKAGELFIQRVKLPANYQVPAHTHPYVDAVTVLSGTLHLGMGEKLDTQKGEAFKVGSFFALPPRHAHYAWTGNEETIIQVQAIGPGGLDYINPADDPRTATATGTSTPPPATGTAK
jgi:quercetin dioxygenase-like cupin family protein